MTFDTLLSKAFTDEMKAEILSCSSSLLDFPPAKMAAESRVAAVTGANKGIGLAIGEHLCHHDDRSDANLLQSALWL